MPTRLAIYLVLFLFSPYAHSHDQMVVSTIFAGDNVSIQNATISGTSETVYTVPNGKNFVLTDVVAIVLSARTLEIYEGATLRLHLPFNPDSKVQYTFKSGFVFGQNTLLKLRAGSDIDHITMSGYLY